MNAISRHADNKHVSAKLDDFGTEGVFLYDGTVIRGTLGRCDKNEFAFRVWNQMQDVRKSDKRCREEWNAANPDRKVSLKRPTV